MKKCAICGKEYEPRCAAQKFCLECRGKMNAPRVGTIDKCRRCGAEYRIVAGNQKYCEACAQELQEQRNRDFSLYFERVRKKTSNKIGGTALCESCGAKYTVISGNQRRCPKCSYQAGKSRGIIGSVRNCSLCGEPYKVRSGNQKYCEKCREEIALTGAKAFAAINKRRKK